jgi:predicted DCC family thiol-disulfide oxidoreductase YuxK
MDAEARVTVLYDEDCGFCRWTADRLRAWDRRGLLRFASIQRSVASLAPVPPALWLESVHAVTVDGRVWSGGAAVTAILRALPAGRLPAAIAAFAPDLTERIYRAVARRRTTLGRLLGADACRVDPSRTR